MMSNKALALMVAVIGVFAIGCEAQEVEVTRVVEVERVVTVEVPVEVTRIVEREIPVEIEVPKIEYVYEDAIPSLETHGNLYCHFHKDSDKSIADFDGIRWEDIWSLWGVDAESLTQAQRHRLYWDSIHSSSNLKINYPRDAAFKDICHEIGCPLADLHPESILSMASGLFQSFDRLGVGFDMTGIHEHNILSISTKRNKPFTVIVQLNLSGVHNSDTDEIGAFFMVRADSDTGCRFAPQVFTYGHRDLRSLQSEVCEAIKRVDATVDCG